MAFEFSYFSAREEVGLLDEVDGDFIFELPIYRMCIALQTVRHLFVCSSSATDK